MNKVSGCDRISAELPQILNDDAVKVLHSIFQQIQKTQQWSQDWKRSVFIPISKKGNAKECSKLQHNCTHFTHQQGAQNPSSQASTVHEPRTSRYTSWIQKRQRNQRSNCQHPLDHRKSKGIPQKTSTSASLSTLRPLMVWITTNCGKFLKIQEYQTTLPAF